MEEKIKQLSQIKKMLDEGFIDDDEFNTLKKEILKDGGVSHTIKEHLETEVIKPKPSRGINNEIELTHEKSEIRNEYKQSDLFKEKNARQTNNKGIFVGVIVLCLIIGGLITYLIRNKNMVEKDSSGTPVQIEHVRDSSNTQKQLSDSASKTDNSIINLKVDSNKVVDDISVKKNSFFISQFLGHWRGDCDNYGTIDINDTDDYATVCVAENQIYIYARMKADNQDSNKMNLYLPKVGELIGDMGSGGNMRPWADYSRKNPIAELVKKPNDRNILLVNWFGFYNIKSNNYELRSPEFLKYGSDTLFNCR